MYNTLNVPLEASRVAIKNDLLAELRVYLALKFHAGSGQIRTSQVDYSALSDLTGFKDHRTINKHIDTLIDLTWIGTDGTWFFLRGNKYFRRRLGAESRSAVEIRPQDVQHIRVYMLGAFAKHTSKKREYADKMCSAKQPFQIFGEKYSKKDFSCTLIAQAFGCSPSTATRMKQKARKLGYFQYRHNKIPLHLSHKQVDQYIKVNGIDPEYVFFYKDKSYIRLTDTFIFGGKTNGLHRYYFKTLNQC